MRFHKHYALLLATLLTACAIQPSTSPIDAMPTLTAGQTWQVPSTLQLNHLTIPTGASLTAPKDKDLTLTVNGVSTTIVPGNYHGDIVLAVTDDIPVQYGELPTQHYRAALYVDNGNVVPDKSVTSALAGGSYDNSQANNLSITSNEDKFNGIYVTGNSKYTINRPVIHMTGNGGNDFAGFGAAIMASGTANVTINDATIINKGAVRTALFVGDHATVHLNNANIETYNGTLPKDYQWNVDLGRMMEVPWMLGLSGNVRASNLVGNGTLYINNSHIKTQGWGALSTDDTQHVRMYVANTVIETTDSGYGAYSIGNALDSFSACTFNVADVGVIVGAEGNVIFTDGTVVNSKRFGVMLHSGAGGGTVTIENGSVFNTKETAIQAKGRGTTITIDNAQLKPANGILIQAMENDDPYMKAMMNGMGAAPSDDAMGSGAPAMGSAAMVGLMSAANSGLSPDVVTTIKNTSLQGDIINARVNEGDLRVTLERATLTGAVSTAIASPIGMPTAQNRRLIGAVNNTFAATQSAKNGAQVTLAIGATWNVTKTSYLTHLTIAPNATLQAADGKQLALSVNGVSKPIVSGDYNGAIVLQVSKH